MSLPPTDRQRLDALHERLRALQATSVGYPCNQVFDCRELFRFLEFSLNNVGDPFAGSNYAQNTHDFEREVVAEFATLTAAPTDNYWGYVTNGGTEGNMYGLYLARELHPDGVVYFSEETHYSVAKILRLQHTRNIMIRAQENGEIDYEDLLETIRLHRDAPPIVFANIGTTMKGAVDNLQCITSIMKELAIQQFYVHADAALSGMILPFVDEPQPWNFAHGADSISISGHKMVGSPLPCGIALARKSHVDRIARSVEYVGVLDTTISGSRNAFTPLVLWMAFRKLGFAGFRKLVTECLAVAQYAVEQLNAQGIAAWRNPNSVTVVFPKPPPAIFHKWVIAPHKTIGHIITMPHVTRAVVDAFVRDFRDALDACRT
ncbi:MAG: histidine decarboxylase [Verrucomicrobiales bacterium]|nr:histidine decarboxylase [Verrucomicrobiales bacterium]